VICSRCDLPIPPEVEPHFDHGPDCPREVCSCDLPVHPECCTVCANDRVLEPT
jgi:hypothetical protein